MRRRGIDPARLTHGAGRRGEAVDTTNSNAIGQLAQARFEERCTALALDGRLWWLRVPDPMIPRGAPDSRGRLLCQPQAREEGTDYLGAWMDRGGVLIGGIGPRAPGRLASVAIAMPERSMLPATMV